MDNNTNIVKAPATFIYTPSEVAYIFREQLKTPLKVVMIEGVYRQNPKSGNYSGYFYDILMERNGNYEITLVVPAAIRVKMKDGTLVRVSGVISKELGLKCSIVLRFHVTRYDVIKDKVISENELKLLNLQTKKSANGFRNVDAILESKLLRGEKPNICLLFAKNTITDLDFKQGLEAARSHIDFVEENETFTQIPLFKSKLNLLDKRGYDVIAIVRGGGNGIKEVFNNPDLIETVVNLSTPFVTGVGHPGEKPFIAKVADKDLGTPSLLGVYFKDLVNSVISQKEKSKAVLVEQVKKQFEERIKASEKQNKELQNKITELNKSAENAQKLYKEQIETMKKQHETTEKQVKVYEEQAKNFNENIAKMQQANTDLQKSLTDMTTQNAKTVNELANAKALTTKLEEQLKLAEKQTKPVILYVILAVFILLAIIYIIYKTF